MPTYEYACADCNHQWEEIQRITEPPVERCPKCSHPSAHRLISGGTNFILKGGGWYSDLYASPKQGSSGSKKADDSGSGSAGSSSKPAESSSSGSSESKGSGSSSSGGSSSTASATPSATPSAA